MNEKNRIGTTELRIMTAGLFQSEGFLDALLILGQFLSERIAEALNAILPFLPHLLIIFIVFVLYLNSAGIHILLTKSYVPSTLTSDSATDVSQHRVLVVIPTFNESNTIRNKLKDVVGFSTDPDYYEVAVVDGSSTDGTVQIVQDFIRSHGSNRPTIHLVKQEERTGKSDGILYCLDRVSFGEVVLVTDANCRLEPNCLEETERMFRDSSIGGLTVKYIIDEHTESWVGKGERFYWIRTSPQRVRESNKGLFFHFCGSLMMMRRSLAREVFESGRFTYAEDMIGGLAVVSTGHRVVHVDGTTITERGICTTRDLVRQKRNRAIGLIDTLKFFRSKKSPHLKRYRISVYLKTLIPLSMPLVFLGILTAFLMLLPFSSFLLLLLGALLACLLVPFVRYFLVIQVAVLLALFDHLMGRRGTFWDKTESDRHWPESTNTTQME